MEKTRLDQEIYRQGLTDSREKAKALVLAGKVKVNGVRVDKPGTNVKKDVTITIEVPPKYVSRGGYKLEKAISDFNIDFKDKLVLDVGASTGGYTDCALQHGAKKVWAIDVGYGQLDWRLRNDPRVINIERTNIRNFTLDDLGKQMDIVTIDVSFISTKLVFPIVKDLIKNTGIIISLIKPQFEAGKDKVGKKGVIRDINIHKEVLLTSIFNANEVGLNCIGVTYSPITGPEGNIEYFLFLHLIKENLTDIDDYVAKVTAEAHKKLGG